MVHVKGASSGHLRRMRQNVHFHRGMGRFYRRHYAGQRPWLDVLVYAGIGAKLAVSLSRNAMGRLLRARATAPPSVASATSPPPTRLLEQPSRG